MFKFFFEEFKLVLLSFKDDDGFEGFKMMCDMW
jgi:hypothetical protein